MSRKKIEPLTKVQRVALDIFNTQFSHSQLFTLDPKDVSEYMRRAFTLAYKFLDISKDFTRSYDE